MSKNEKLTTREQWDKVYTDRNLPLLPDTKSWLGRQIFPIIDKFCNLQRPIRFLEAGCAPGRYGIYFFKSFNATVLGFDYSLDGVELTRNNWKTADIVGEVYEADVFSLPALFNNSFDVVLSAGLVEHFSEPHELISIFHGLLKEGGIIITIVPNTTRSLNTDLLRIFNKKKYNKMKNTHLEINHEMLSEYHDQFDILYSARVTGFFADSMVSSGNVFAKWIRRIINKFLSLISPYSGRLQNDYLASHFFLVGKKRKSVTNS